MTAKIATEFERSPIPADRIFTPLAAPERPLVTYTISARNKPAEVPIFSYLRSNYGNVQLREIDSVFGFVERSTLYGGREFTDRELSHWDVVQLNSAGIGLRLPMSNHDADADEYRHNSGLLSRYHRKCNSIIVTNDELAKWIRQDFPLYRLDASVIKNIKTHKKIEEALKIYDTVVLPMSLNEDLEFLKNIENKDKIVLFANAGCALTCPSKICYRSLSTMNKGKGGEFKCSQDYKKRDMYGMVDFPLEPYIELGFHQFKLLRSRPGGITGF